VRRVIGFRAVLAIATVVDCDEIALDFRPGCPGNIELPGVIVTRLQRKPPQGDEGACAKDGRKLQQVSANKYDDRKQRDYKQTSAARHASVQPSYLITRMRNTV